MGKGVAWGFVGPSYEHPISTVDAEKTVNWVPERTSGGQAKADLIFVARPGTTSFSDDLTSGWRGWIIANRTGVVADALFVVCNDVLYELDSTGQATNRGAVGNDFQPVSMAYNGLQGGQIIILSGGLGYIFTLATNALVQIADAQFPADAVKAVFWRRHFVVIPRNSVTFHLSDIDDGSSWTTADIGEKDFTQDYIEDLLVDEDVGELWLIGTKKTEVWRYTGASGFPAEPVDVVIPHGSPAHFGNCLVSGSVYSLSQSVDGGRSVRRYAGGYAGERIATHAVEYSLKHLTEADIASAYAFAIEDFGHRWFILQFLSANLTWVYDESTDLWTNWDFHDPATGLSRAFLGIGHIFCFGKHLLGPWVSQASGGIYEFSPDTYTDYYGYNGTGAQKIRLLRRAPYVSANGKRVRHDALTLEFQMGVGIAGGAAPEINPVALVRWSDDQGKTWGPEVEVSLGAQGEYAAHAQIRQLGIAGFAGRVYEVSVTAKVVRGLVNAYLDLGRPA